MNASGRYQIFTASLGNNQALRQLAGRYAIVLRLGGTTLFTAAAAVATTQAFPRWWLAATAGAALWAWSAFFVWQARRSGLTRTLVLADTVVIAALALGQQHLVPATLVGGIATWMLPLACTSVYILQIALPTMLGLSGAAVLVAAYGFGAGHAIDVWLLAAETIGAAGVVAVVRGCVRQADATVAAGLTAERQIRAEEARRADEREQHRQLHDTALSTLTMVAAGAFAGPSAALNAQAARDLRVLHDLTAAPGVPVGPDMVTSMADPGPELERAAASTRELAIRLGIDPVLLPSAVVDQLAACVSEALRNIERHAGTGQAEVSVTGGVGWAIVKITDNGRGFDPAAIPPSRRGISDSIVGRMMAIGGRASIASRPGAGTTVTVSWPT